MNKSLLLILILMININAQYRVERIVNGGASKFGEMNSEVFNIYDGSSIIYSIKQELNYDDPFSEAKLFTDGSVVIINSFLNRIDFYSNSGNKIGAVEKIDDEKFSYEKTVYCYADIDEAAFLISNEKSGESRIEIYSKFGSLLNSLSVEGNKGNGIYYDQSNELIVYSTITWNNLDPVQLTKGIDKAGNKKFEVNNSFSFSENSDRYFLGYSNKSILCIDMKTNKVIMNEMFADRVILSAKLKNDSIYFVESEFPKLSNNKWISGNSIYKKYSIAADITEVLKSINYNHSVIVIDENQNLIIDGKEVAIN